MYLPESANSYVGVHLAYKLGGKPGEDFDIEKAVWDCPVEQLLDFVYESASELPTFGQSPEKHSTSRAAVRALNRGKLHEYATHLISEAVLLRENPGIQGAINKRRRGTKDDD